MKASVILPLFHQIIRYDKSRHFMSPFFAIQMTGLDRESQGNHIP